MEKGSQSDESSDDFGPLPAAQKSEAEDSPVEENEENELLENTFGIPIKFGKRSWKERSMLKKVETSSLQKSKTNSSLLQSLIKEKPKNIEASVEETVDQEETNLESSNAEMKAIKQNDPYFIPFSECTHFKAHNKTVTAVAVDPTQTYLITGGNDSEVAIWDFCKMNASPKPFKRMIPSSGHAIQSFAFSFDAKHFVCASGDAIGRVYTITGKKVQETVKGDMYVRDLSQTVGHTHAVNDCIWHPTNKSRFLLASSDATIRVFDLTSKPYGVDQALPHVHILKSVDKRNLNIAGRCQVTSLAVAPFTGKFIIGGCSDGSLQLWNEQKIIRGAHGENLEISSLCILNNETQLISRSTDGTMKLWDIRLFSKPSNVWDNLPATASNTAICISPNENMVATGTASTNDKAFVYIYDIKGNYELKHKIEIEKISSKTSDTFPLSIPSIAWPSEINQIIVGASDGYVRIYYDSDVSQEGALSFLSRPPHQEDPFENFAATPYIPDELPLGFKQTRSGEIRKVRIRPEELKAATTERKIQPPLPEECTSKIGMASTMLGQLNEQDPAEALRAYAEIAEKDPIFVSKAYMKTQPKTILDYSSPGGDDEKLITGVNKCPRCGLKLCQCGYMRLNKACSDVSKRFKPM